MQFTKGQSGNPNGRKRGIVDKRSRDRQAAAKDAPAVLAMLAEKAKGGDVDAAKVYLDFTIGKPKPEPARRPIVLDGSLPLEDQGRQLRDALSRGLLSPEEFSQVSAGLGQHSTIEQLGAAFDVIALLANRNGIPLPPALRLRVPITVNAARTNESAST